MPRVSSGSSGIKYLNVGLEEEEEEKKQELSEEEQIETEVKDEEVYEKTDVKPVETRAISRTPKISTPLPDQPAENLFSSHVTLNVTGHEETKKLRLRKSNVISIVNDLIYLLENSAKNSDVEVILKRIDNGVNEEIPKKVKPNYVFNLHSLVLSARSVFARERFENAEEEKGDFRVSGIKYHYSYENGKHILNLKYVNVDVFQEFVKFLYIAQCKVNRYNFIGLIQLARGFGVKCLDNLVSEFIAKKLESFNNNKKGFNLSELINYSKVAYDYELSEEIKNRCIDLLSECRDELIQTEAWDVFAHKYSNIVCDMLTRK